MNLNKVFLIGRLTQDPESRTTPTGQNVSTLRMATNRVWTDQASGQKREATEYHTVIAWGRLGQIASQYLKRGAMAMIEGRLQTRSWESKEGAKRYTTEIIAENLQMGPRSGAPEGGYTTPRPSSPMNPPARPTPEPSGQIPEQDIPIIGEDELAHQGVEESTMPVREEDLPF